MATKIRIFFNFSVLLLIALNGHCSKLNVARILLPIFDDFSTNFTIHATDDSCYKWSTTREDIIKLSGLDSENSDCSNAVIVSTVTKDKSRTISDIFAENLSTKQVIRCVVIVDAIDSLAITTTTKELILEEAPESFEVRAYDNQGNEFSTLAGIEFEWMIKPVGPNKDLPVLRFMTFRDSPYETPATLAGIEENNKMGHKVLLEGTKTGISKVSVKLPQTDYMNVKSNEVQLTVIANLMIVPQEVYIMVGDVVEFEVIHTSYGKSEVVELKSSQYFLDVADQIVASLESGGTVEGLAEGTTKIILHDRNIDENEPGLKLPSSILHVVKPAYMVLGLLPYRNWATLVSEAHDIVAELYSEDDHKLMLGPGMMVQMQVSEAFHVRQRSVNGSLLSGWTETEGVAEVSAVLESFNPPITANNEIIIYPRIVLEPSEVILPWDEVSKPKYDIDIKATGGDGKFIWSSSNHTLGIVNQNGKVHTNSHGCFEISASMYKNHNNRQSVKFHILPPSRLEIVEYVMEAEVGSTIFLHIALYAAKTVDGEEEIMYIPYSKCQDLPFKLKMTDPKFSYNKALKADPVGISCGNVAIVSSEVGTSKVTVHYHGDGGKALHDSVTITYYKPLRLLQPTEQIVLGVGTTTNLIFTGGPKHVIGSTPNKYVISSFDDIVSAVDTTEQHKMPPDEDYTVVNVLCQKLGKSTIILNVSNSPNIPNCKNQEASVAVVVICSKPRTIEFQPEIKVADAQSCPMDLSADRVVVESNQPVDLLVKVKDDKGREFLNISSFQFNWDLNPKGLGSVKNEKGISERHASIGTAIYAHKSYQKISPKVVTGQLTVIGTLVGYRKDVTNANKVKPEWPEFMDEDEKGVDLAPIKSSITLYLVDDTIVTPNVISIYNHPENRNLLDVKQGSGYYQIALGNEDIAEVKYLQHSRQLEIRPMMDGVLNIKLIDLCLISKPATIVVTVVSVHIIRVEMSDKVEKDKCIDAIVKLYDEYDNLLTIPNLDLIELSPVLEVDIARVSKKPITDSTPPGEIHYVITGEELGDTRIVFSIGDPDFDGYVSSAPLDLQVFPPLKIFPRNITIAIGSVFQYSSRGGPQPIPNLEYRIKNTDTAHITTNGILKGLVAGQTTVNAMALGTNPTTAQKVIYAEDTAKVLVIKLTTVKASSPLTRLQVGSTIPIWAAGVPDQISPLVLGSIEPSVKFDWGIQDADIVKLESPFKYTGIEYNPLDMLTIHLTGLSAGHTVIYLNATFSKASYKKIVYASSIEIEVFEKLILIEPEVMSSPTIVIAPYSQLQLKTNMDSWAHLTYKIFGDNPSSLTEIQSNHASSSSNPICISPSGLVRSFGTLGHSMVLITALDTNGLKQSITVPIEVKQVHYMLLSVKSNWKIKRNSPTVVIPLGTEFDIFATFYDNTGNEFSAGSIDQLQLTMSRLDLLKVKRGPSNTTFHVSTKKPGVTVIKIWSEGLDKISDYLKIHVEQVISPVMDYATIGDVICFKTPVTGVPEGQWSVSDAGSLTSYGNGVILITEAKSGMSSITHTWHSAAPLQLKLNPLTDIFLESSYEVLTNDPDKPYKAHVVLSSSNLRKINNLITGWDCAPYLSTLKIKSPITCELYFEGGDGSICPADIFTISSRFNHKEGKHYCEISALPESNKKYNTITLDGVKLTISAPDNLSKDIKLKFLPAIYSPKELLLDSQFTGELVITGLNSVLKTVEVTPADSSILYVSGRTLRENKLTYIIKLLDYNKKMEDSKDFMSINIRAKATNQCINVLVKAQNTDKFAKTCGQVESTPILNYLHSNRQMVGIICAVCVLFIASFYVYCSYLQPTVNVNVLTNGKNDPCASMNMSNKSCAAISFMQSTPCRTPQHSSILNSTNESHTDHCYCTRSPEIRRNRRYM